MTARENVDGPRLVKLRVRDLILDPRFQHRSDGGGGFNEAEIERMRAEGRARGHADGWDPDLYEPIRVWGAECGIFVLAGFHRTGLAQACEREEIEGYVHEGIDEAEALRIADRSNLQARALDPVDEAELYRRAFDEGCTAEEVARRFDRRSPGHYERRVALAYLAPELKGEVRRRLLGVDYAEAIGQAAREGASPRMQVYLADLARTTKARVDLFRRMVAALLARARSAVPASSPAGALFDLGAYTDTSVEAAAKAIEEASRCAAVHDGWTVIRRAVQAQIRRLEREGVACPGELARMAAELDGYRAAADRALGAVLGERQEAGAVVAGASATREASQLLKWVGSKRKEAPLLVPLIRSRLSAGGRYVEPFFGSGAVFFALGWQGDALVGDVIPDIVELYQTVAEDPALVDAAVRHLIGAVGFTEQGFYRVRDKSAPQTPAGRAARVFYLNRCGFNGLWRTNKAGKVNIPWGKRDNPAFPTLADFERAAMLLRRAEIRRADWRELVDAAGAGDCIFADPPYPGTFTGYAKEGAVGMPELAEGLALAHSRGAEIVLTLPDLPEGDELFGAWGEKAPLSRRTGVSCKGDARGRLDQVVWTSKERERE